MPTLSVPLIAAMFFERFRIHAGPIMSLATDFSAERAKKGQQIIARVGQTPSAPQDYDSTDGFFPTPDDAKSLLVDVPITMDQFKTVPIEIPLADSIEATIDLMQGTVDSAAEVLGKAIFDHAMATILAANFSGATVLPAADSDYDMLETVRKALNAQGAGRSGRFGFVSPDVFTALDDDARITSKDYRGQTSDNAYGSFVGLKGFQNIWEYPDMPATGNLSAFFGNKSAIAVASRLPADIGEYANRLGVVQTVRMTPITDEETGITLLFVTSQNNKTGDLQVAVAAIYGAAAGKQGGANGSIMDNAGHRLVTA
ncbi:MAG: hypothetical protein AAFX93_19535 [Verrucomicrobiota bacterium]